MREKHLTWQRDARPLFHPYAGTGNFCNMATTRLIVSSMSFVARIKCNLWRIQGTSSVGLINKGITRPRNCGELKAYSISERTQSDFAESGESKTIIASAV